MTKKISRNIEKERRYTAEEQEKSKKEEEEERQMNKKKIGRGRDSINGASQGLSNSFIFP